MLEVLAHGSFCKMRCGHGNLSAQLHCQSRGGKPFYVAAARLLQMLLGVLVQCTYNTTLKLSHKVPFDHLTDYWLCHEINLMRCLELL